MAAPSCSKPDSTVAVKPPIPVTARDSAGRTEKSPPAPAGTSRNRMARAEKSLHPPILARPALLTARPALLTVRLVPEKRVITLGEPLYLEFVVRNRSRINLQTIEGGNQRNRLGRFDDYKLTAVDAQGKALPVIDSSPSFGGKSWVTGIPGGGTYSRRLFLPHWVKLEKPGRYTITGKRKYKIRRRAKNSWFGKSGKMVQVEAKTTITVTAPSPRKLGALIEKLGRGLLGKDGNIRFQNLRTLSAINDRRVVPWYLKALGSSNYGLKSAALRELSRFNSDAALEGLKRGLKTRGRDLDGGTTGKWADRLAANLRLTSVASLARSKHPGAWKLLGSLRRDPDHQVRLTVLHAFARQKKSGFLGYIRELTGDQNGLVRGEARRYLKLLTTSP